MKIRATSLLLCALSGGCTIVQVEGPARVTMLRPGVMTIVPAPEAALVAYRIRGLGVVPGRSGATLGWSREEAVIVPDPAQCHVILFDPPKNDSVWATLLRDNPDICTRRGK